MAKTVQNK